MDSLISILLYLCCTLSIGVANQNTKGPIITSYHVTTEVFYRFAMTQVSNQIFYNSTATDFIVFNLTIPDRAMITNFTMKVNQTYFSGFVTTRDVEKQMSLSSSVQDHKYGRLISNPTNSNRFIVREHVQGLTRVTFNVTYMELLQRRDGQFTSPIYITPNHPVRNIYVRTVIKEPRRVIKAYLLSNDHCFQDGRHDIVVNAEKSTILEFSQKFTKKTSQDVKGVMTLQYFLGSFLDAGDILMSRDYYIHYFSPKISKPVPKDVLFLLDISGSMANNNKLNQLKKAMSTILKTIKSFDRFNIMLFSEHISLYKRTAFVSGSKIGNAIKYINALKPAGDTDISKAILGGIEYINEYSKNSNKSFIFFLTDGHSTSGISDTRRILELTRATNKYDVPIFTIAFGKDADWHLTRSLAAENFGISRRILDGSSASAKIIDFYNEISPSVMSAIQFRYYLNGLHQVNYNLIRQNLRNYYRGSELVVTGRLQTAQRISNYKYLESRVDGLRRSGNISLTKSSPQYNGNYDGMIDRIWSYLMIENLIRQHQLALDSTERKRINTRLQRMASKYNVVTPITVMLADASTDGYYGENINSLNSVNPLELHNADPIVLKSERKSLKPPSRFISEGGRDPHFVIQSPHVEYPVCFNILGSNNDIIQLLRDPEINLRINIQIHKDPQTSAMFITEVGVATDKTFHWNISKIKVYQEASVEIIGGRRVNIEFKNGMMVHISNNPRHNGHYFNIGISREEKLSPATTGLLGMFIHHLNSRKPDNRRPNTRILTTSLNGYALESKAKLVERIHPLTEENITCWALPTNGEIMKTTSVFKVKKIFK
ncbi:hypothetical protein LOTGIDRAFT_173861 [Lottia gigantea]|uniref:VWFA domain-containing protein n=1 Tax=Lottia gigantea TaxID=225164 RepID=V4CB99_LOTGI|nr:hypothetical protein LOTGIDRAFT_173861 [Lottia gigantea]ESO99119.1 hypothetical protein LOTGIDRAFT_173861 [Lottia gigantea]